jgi:hypothetical protein
MILHKDPKSLDILRYNNMYYYCITSTGSVSLQPSGSSTNIKLQNLLLNLHDQGEIHYKISEKYVTFIDVIFLERKG